MAIEYETVPISEVIRADETNHGHWFSTDTQRFFKSRWDAYAYKQKGFYFWVSSEKFNDSTPRKYTIRFACCNCMSIHDISGFQAFATKREAVARLKYVLKTWNAPELVAYHHWKMELKHEKCPSETTGGD